MRSLLSVIKQNRVSKTDQIVLIPDAPIPKSLEAEAVEKEAKESFSPDEIIARTIERAQKEAESVSREILKKANAEQDALLKKAQHEAESIREEAYQEGLERGRAEKQAEIHSAIDEANAAIQQLEQQAMQYIATYEEELKNLAVDVASRILSKRITPESGELTELVRAAVNTVKDADWITVEISERMPALLNRLMNELQDCGNRVEVVARDLPDDACIVQTQDGTLDASVSTQLKNVREYFGQI